MSGSDRAQQLTRDIRACVDFFLWDPWAMFRAIRTHTCGAGGQCTDRCGPWPCITARTASYAERIHRARRLAHVPPVSDTDTAFEAAIHANSIETTAPMRAVATPVPGAPAGRHRSTKKVAT